MENCILFPCDICLFCFVGSRGKKIGNESSFVLVPFLFLCIAQQEEGRVLSVVTPFPIYRSIFNIIFPFAYGHFQDQGVALAHHHINAFHSKIYSKNLIKPQTYFYITFHRLYL